MNETKYLKFFFGATLSLVAAVAATNYAVNPLGIYNTPVIKGLNDVHPAALAYSRLQKTEAVKRLQPEVIITGSSRADNGLDPAPEFFGDLRAYNFALAASSILEQRRTLEFAQAAHPLKEAVITLDFFCFNARRLENAQFDPKRLSPEALSPLRSFIDSYGTLFSLDTLIAAQKNLLALKHLDRYSYPLASGRRINNDVEHEIALHGAAQRFIHAGNENEMSVDDFSFAYSATPGDTTFKHLEAMLDFARVHHIRVTLLISPVHETYLASLENSGKAALVEEWKARVAEIVRANAARFGAKTYPLWDFAYRNRFTTEPVPAADDLASRPKWFWDSNHYKKELGDIVLRKVLGLGRVEGFDGFGRKLVE